MTDLRNAARLVLRTSGLFTVEQPPGSGSAANPPALAVPMSGQADTQPSTTASGTALMIVRDGRRRGLRRTKRASALLPGDAIRLKSGARVVITYVSRGAAPNAKYIEWRDHSPKNWANVPLDTPVRLAWRLPRLWKPRVSKCQEPGDPQAPTIALNRTFTLACH